MFLKIDDTVADISAPSICPCYDPLLLSYARL
jgi:hypothetical protein